MEPLSGVMDNGLLHESLSFRPLAGFNSYDDDVADEEIHFSRDFAVHPHYQTKFQQQQQQQQQQRQLSYNPAAPMHHLQPDALANSHLSNRHAVATNGTGCASFISASTEQARSSKLLNSIGSKLRWGSNYLAPAKMLGQYLLGITVQSWSEFLNTSRMMKAPTNTHQLTSRVLTNLNYFQGNYLCVSLILIIYCILTSPLLLLAIISYLLTLYFVTSRSATGRPLRFAGYRPNLQQLYSFITLVSLPLLWVAGAPSAVFWVIGASFVVVGLHASMFSPQSEQLQKPITSAEISAEQRLNVPALSKRSASVQYYNHYPTAPATNSWSTSARNQQYLSLAATEQPSTTKETNYYAHAISQWIPFGGSGSGAMSKWASSNSGSAPGSATAAMAEQSSTIQARLPEVKIISQDYAGLGRVYEI